MLKVSDKIEVTIEKIVFGGEGLGYYNDMVIFVPMSCIGDKLLVKIISVKKTYARALIDKILVSSSDRSNELISFEENVGCDFNHIKYEKQLEYKSIMLKDMFKSISKLDVSNVYEGIIRADNILNYRNKVATPFFKIEGKIHTGFFKRKSHDIFYVEKDLLKSKIATKIENKLLEKLNLENFTVYNDSTNKGFLKTLIIRNNSKNEVMIGVVVNKKTDLKKLEKVLKHVYNENDEIVSVYVSIKNKQNNIILGEENILLFGSEYITEKLFNIEFKIYLDSFFQINIDQVVKLYKKAIEYLGDSKQKNVIDAFSGTGTIAMILSNVCRKIYAIESVKSAVKSGKKVAKENNIDNIEFVCNKVENSIDKILNTEKIDYIVFDPPRKGLDTETIKEVSNSNIKKVVYISCEPSRFARDLNIFMQYGYTMLKLSAVDMFSNTHHLDTVALLFRK